MKTSALQLRNCPRCLTAKLVSEFYFEHGKPHGYCKDCAKQERRDAHKNQVISLFGEDEWARREAVRRKKAAAKPGNKVCARCLVEQARDQFYQTRTKGDVDCYCKPCRNAVDKESNARSPRARLATLLGAARTRAINGGLTFDLTIDDLVTLWEDQQGKCWYTGSNLTYDGTRKPEAVSIDRVDSSAGYVLRNVVLCCRRINEMKREMSLEVFYAWCEKLLANRRAV